MPSIGAILRRPSPSVKGNALKTKKDREPLIAAQDDGGNDRGSNSEEQRPRRGRRLFVSPSFFKTASQAADLCHAGTPGNGKKKEAFLTKHLIWETPPTKGTSDPSQGSPTGVDAIYASYQEVSSQKDSSHSQEVSSQEVSSRNGPLASTPDCTAVNSIVLDDPVGLDVADPVKEEAKPSCTSGVDGLNSLKDASSQDKLKFYEDSGIDSLVKLPIEVMNPFACITTACGMLENEQEASIILMVNEEDGSQISEVPLKRVQPQQKENRVENEECQEKKHGSLDNLLVHLDKVPSSAKKVICDSYARAALLNARVEAQRAELELRKIELESIRVKEEIRLKLAHNGTYESAFNGQSRDSGVEDDTRLEGTISNLVTVPNKDNKGEVTADASELDNMRVKMVTFRSRDSEAEDTLELSEIESVIRANQQAHYQLLNVDDTIQTKDEDILELLFCCCSTNEIEGEGSL